MPLASFPAAARVTTLATALTIALAFVFAPRYCPDYCPDNCPCCSPWLLSLPTVPAIAPFTRQVTALAIKISY